MRRVFIIAFISIGIIIIVHSFSFCVAAQTEVKPESDAVTQRLDYLEKTLNNNQKVYSNMLNTLNIYIAIFLTIVLSGAGLAWWNNNTRSRREIKKQLTEAKKDLLEVMKKTLNNQEEKHEIKFAILTGRANESFARHYHDLKSYLNALIWYARAFEKYTDKKDITNDHKENVLGWMLNCLGEIDSLSDKDANELNEIFRLIDENQFGIQKKKLLVRIEELTKPKKSG